MERTQFGNRPAQLAALTKIEDFITDQGLRVRVSLKLVQSNVPDHLLIDAQAFEVDVNGYAVTAPDGRPSRTPNTQHSIVSSSLGLTHTLHPGWVRVVGTYDEASFEATAPRGVGKPVAEPDWDTNPTGQYYDTQTGIGYRWVEGEVLRIARGKVEEMERIVRNSGALSGISW